MSYIRRAGYTNLDLNTEKTRESFSGIAKLISGVVFLVATISVITLTAGSSQNTEIEFGQIELLATGDENVTPQVEIDLGILLGKTMKSRNGRNYSAFHNIPYAKPSVGMLRFEPPQEYTEKWSGIRNATTRGNKCIQNRKGMTEIQGSEDCHYLNVYTPKLPKSRLQKTLLPVMFYMYGGGFKGGQASNYGGDYMMDKDVVIVLPEYRLGVMGYISTGDSVITGNMGFKDQVMALKWVQKNIKNFGGDPNKVTIFGNSAGSMAVHAHLLSNMTTGLFHRAISQSGLAISGPTGILLSDPKKLASEIATTAGCPNVEDSKELAKCLKNLDAATVLNAQGTRLFSLTVEAIPEDGNMSNIFLYDTPLNLMQQGKLNPNVPWIIGVNDGERNLNAVSLNDPKMVDYYNNSWEIAGPIALDYVDDKTHTVSQQIRKFYFGDKDIGIETRLNFTNAMNDREFTHPAVISAYIQSSFENSSPIYMYWLSKVPLFSVGDALKEVFDPPYGVAHSDEVQFLFLYLNEKFPFIGPDSPDYNMSLLMIDIWTTFADTGKPPNIWTPVPKKRLENELLWFHLDTDYETIMMEPEGIKERVEFWDGYPLNYLYIQNVTHY